MKPEPEIYLKVLEDLNYNSKEVLFIDDNPWYVGGAEKVGIKSILFQDSKKLLRELTLLRMV